jgi:lipopolysaccharide export LptBFGC system permease protein LptF
MGGREERREMKRFDGYKTYIGAGLGLASVFAPLFGVSAPISASIGIFGAVVAIYGRKHANSRFAKAFNDARGLS